MVGILSVERQKKGLQSVSRRGDFKKLLRWFFLRFLYPPPLFLRGAYLLLLNSMDPSTSLNEGFERKKEPTHLFFTLKSWI